MIEGIINAFYEPVVNLSLQGPEEQRQEVETVVDTSYNGYLTLPHSVVAELQLPRRSQGKHASRMVA